MQAHELKPGDRVEIVLIGRVVDVDAQPDYQVPFTSVTLMDERLIPLPSGRPNGFTIEIPDNKSQISTTITKI